MIRKAVSSGRRTIDKALNFPYTEASHNVGLFFMVKIVVPVSGGKDSQAALKLALQHYNAADVLGLFCDTRYEHPITYAHIHRMAKWYGVEIVRVSAGSVEQQVAKHGRFPGGGARFCTEELKIWPTKWFLKSLAEQQGGFEVWYGMRANESADRAKRYAGKVSDDVYAPHEVLKKYPQYLAKLGVRFRLCILDWHRLDVMEYLAGEHNPLYELGFDRVGCFPCLASGDAWKAKAFRQDSFGAHQHENVIRLSAVIGKSVWTSKRGRVEFEGCSVCSI